MFRPLKIQTLIFIALLSSIAPLSEAHEIGNGGGAWVCREADHSIRWAELVDLFEARNEFNLTLTNFSEGLTYQEIADLVMRNIFRAYTEAYAPIQNGIEAHEYLSNSAASVSYIDSELRVIDDSNYRIRPNPSLCVDGTLSYEQVVNYKNDGTLLVSRELFTGVGSTGVPNLSSLQKAALLIHEELYAFRRSKEKDPDSTKTRRAIGFLFSNMQIPEMRNTLFELFKRPDFFDRDGLVARLQDQLWARSDAYYFSDPHVKNQHIWDSMQFVSIQPGTFLMGSPESEPGRNPDETLHSVTLTKPFQFMVTEITQEQWLLLMGPIRHIGAILGTTEKDCPHDSISQEVLGTQFCYRHPMRNVSWYGAQSFTERLTKVMNDGYVYRLPTEAEWEYVERAGTQSAYFTGSVQDSVFRYGWIPPNSEGTTHKVATLLPNAWGIFDLQGNVTEWVSDWYGQYPSDPVIDPQGPSSGYRKISRGVSYSFASIELLNNDGTRTPVDLLRSAARSNNNPNVGYFGTAGIRLVRESSPLKRLRSP